MNNCDNMLIASLSIVYAITMMMIFNWIVGLPDILTGRNDDDDDDDDG